jgi:hypothetical protein
MFTGKINFLAGGLFIALVLLFVMMFGVLRVLYPILGIIRTLALLGLLILLAVFVLGFALLVLGHCGLLTFGRCATGP